MTGKNNNLNVLAEADIINCEDYLAEDIEKVHQAITEKFLINSKYLFSMDTQFEGDLYKDIISERLRKELQTKGFPVFENGIIMKEKDNEWSIMGKNEKMFVVRKEDEKLNIYFCFDAWYTNRPYVLQRLAELGQSTAKKLREDLLIPWHKDINYLRELLQVEGTAPKHWEDGPDGCLAGIAIVLAGWVANQAASKTRDNPQDRAKMLFEDHIRPLINASMDLGIKMAESERKT